MAQQAATAPIEENSSGNPYDEVAYVGYPFAQTHPERLSAIATLFGMEPAPVGECRVLELGCGDGGNLIPMAYTLPNSRFVGIDLAQVPVERGNQLIAELGLSNIELACADIMAFDAAGQQFDYIIAHGVFSWVPDFVRAGLLELCRKLLAPHGVAYVSYNCYPGYHLRNLTREMMRFHTRSMSEPREAVQQGLSLLQWLLRRFPNEETARTDLYGTLLTEQFELLMSHRHREQVYHDDLAEENTPFYFHQFNALAEAHGLQYLGEADYFEMQDFIYPPAIREVLAGFPAEQIVLKEQYLDFLKGRMFRQTLLCRQDVKLQRQTDARELRRFYFETEAESESAEIDLSAQVVVNFRGPRGAKLQTDFPLAKAALLVLKEASPRALSWDELLQAASTRLSHSTDIDETATDTLAEILLAACGSGLVRLHGQAPQFTTIVSERPQASRLARLQASHGDVVTNLLHKSVEVEDALSLKLLHLLDGTRNYEMLTDELLQFALHNGEFKRVDGVEFSNDEEKREAMAVALMANLQKASKQALLIA